MALTAEQIAEARKEGYTDAEILQHYAASKGIDLKAARDEGYSDSEILSHFSGAEVEPQTQQAPQTESMLSSPELSGALGAGAGAVYSAKTLPVKAAKAFGTAVANRLPGVQPTPTTPSPSTYTTPAGINVEQTPGGMHPGAVGNAQFNVEQQQANKLHQNVPPGFEAKGTSRILTPVGMQEPAAALGGVPSTTRGSSILAQKRAEGWPIVRETTQAVKSAAPAIGGAAKNIMTSSPVAGAMAGYNLQDAMNRYREGDVTGATIGGIGAASQLLPRKGKAGLIKTGLGLGAAGLNALRGEPQGYANGRRVLLEQGIKTAKKLASDAPTGYLHHTEINPNPLVGSRYETKELGGLMPVKPISVESLKGKMVNANPWDDTSRNVQVLSVSGKPLINPVTTHGGHAYARDIEHAKKGIAGASGEAIAKRVQARADLASREGLNLGGTGEVVTLPSTMGKFSGNFAFPTTELYYDYFKQAEMPKRMVKELSDTLASRPGQSKGYYEAATHLNDPDIMEAFKQNSDFRKAFLEEMQKKKYQKILGINAEDAANAMADPNLIGVPRGYVGHTAIGMRPGAEITPSSNISYSHNTAGDYLGSLPHTPIQVMLNRPYEQAYQELAAKYPSKSPSAINQMAVGALETRGSGISELMDEQAINRIGQYHEGLSQGKFDPYDVNAALQYLKTPGIYKEGGEVKHMEKGGLAALAKKALKKYGVGLGLTAPFAAEAGQDVAKGDMGPALDLASGFLPAPAMAAYMGLAPSETAPMHMDQYPGRQGTDPLAGSGSVMEGYVPGMAAGGSTIKRMMNEVMEGFGPKVAKEIVPGAPHTYPPQVPAGTQWMQDYVPAAAQAAKPAPEIVYMGKYRRGTPEERAAAKMAQEDAMRSVLESRKQQYIKGLQESGWSPQDIDEHIAGPHAFGAPWIPR